MRRHIILLVATVLLPVAAVGQATPGKNLTVDMIPSNVTVTNGIARIDFRLNNRAESHEQVFVFTLDAPSPALVISRPAPQADWIVLNQYRGRSVAQWGVLGNQLQPASVSTVLSIEAKGLPTIVRSWVQGNTPPPVIRDTDVGDPPPSNPLLESSIEQSAVGIEPFPATNPGSLVLRLLTLHDRACGLGWVQDAAFCQNLKTTLQHAQLMIGQRNYAAARSDLTSYRNSLTTQRGSQVTDQGFWLLTVNTTVITGLLP